MKKIFSAETTRMWDFATIKERHISSLKLMENAAEALTEAFTARWNTDHPVIVFAGSGNNGGDGLAMARMLSMKGYVVKLYLFQFSNSLSSDTAENIKRLPEEVDFIPVNSTDEITRIFTNLQESDLLYIPPYPIVIDALFGSGLNRPLTGHFIDIVLLINGLNTDIVSIDIPSGLHSEDNAHTLSQCIIQADVTFAIQRPKLTHLLKSNQVQLGEIEVIPIGLSEKAEKKLDTSIYWLEDEDEISATLQELKKGHSFVTWSSDEIKEFVQSSNDSYSRLKAIRNSAKVRNCIIHYTDMYNMLCCPDGTVYIYE